LPRWLDRSVAEPLARQARTLTLFVSSSAGSGLIDAATGDLQLRSILVPINHAPDYRAAIELARSTSVALGRGVVRITLVHVGGDAMVWPELEDGPDWSWHRVQRAGDPVVQILAAADDVAADLIVMPTQGHDGILDMLRGSTTEQVLRMAKCPLLAVPAQ
jgi:nucleotide-binding universal stress UspA family protein